MPGGRTAALALPGVQTEVMVIAAGGKEGDLVTESVLHLETERITVEGDGPLEIRHFQVHVTNARGWIDR